MTETLIEGHKPLAPPPGIPVLDIDPYDVDTLYTPHAYYEALRAAGPVAYIPRYQVLAVGRFDETKTTFSDHETFVSSRGIGLNDFKLEKPWRPPSIILEVDPPEHTRTRRVMSKALSPKVVRGLMDDFRNSAATILDGLLGREIEAVVDLAEAFPTAVFPRAVGMKDVHTRHLVDYGAIVFNAVGPDNVLRQRDMARAPEVAAWINAACARDRLTDDGLGALVYAAADAGDITEAEAGMLVRSFLSAGVDTTVTGIGNALWCFSQNPDQWEALKADPSLIRPAFEEVLRYTSPVHTFLRTADRDTEIGGHPVPEGTKVLCVLASANMDPEKWGDPEVFRVDRRPVGHMAFGAGIHGCVGQNIARGELEALLSVMIEKVDRIEPMGEAIWRPNNAIRALDKLPLKLIPS
ncbi:cytochrome P450 [Mesobacterium pallidum]|uniref:cytochrome P450 n=1 Tax=Mesobacterium pallidum TaxID=2872037 RepID=UPI001EE2444A|nr:cytochrome P450 [Mesobacterium pallidum]